VLKTSLLILLLEGKLNNDNKFSSMDFLGIVSSWNCSACVEMISKLNNKCSSSLSSETKSSAEFPTETAWWFNFEFLMAFSLPSTKTYVSRGNAN